MALASRQFQYRENAAMNTTLPSQLLTDHHRRIDRGVQGIVDGDGEVAALAESMKLLRSHLYAEEELLFPRLEETGLTMPVFVMKQEHGQMWPWLETLTHACSSGSAVTKLRRPARELFHSRHIHNTKEEQILYTATDGLPAGSEGDSLTEVLKDAQAPDDWVCANAPNGRASVSITKPSDTPGPNAR